MPIIRKHSLLWSCRGLIAIVLFFNLQCAIAFLWKPEWYEFGFRVDGISGQALVRGFGILFLMWNIPYVFALIQPHKNMLSLIEAIIMQFIGLVGESLLVASLPLDENILRNTTLRFIYFDGAGLGLLLTALIILFAAGRRLDDRFRQHP
jgi:hypothetical protein